MLTEIYRNQENGFHIMLDETSPYIAGWFAATVLTLMLLKYIYLGQGLGEQGEAEVIMSLFIIIFMSLFIMLIIDQQVVYQSVLSLVKPSVTLATGLFCCAIHAYVYDLRYCWQHRNHHIHNHDHDRDHHLCHDQRRKLVRSWLCHGHLPPLGRP